jgi:hypothetical protein
MTKDKQWSTKHCTESWRLNNANTAMAKWPSWFCIVSCRSLIVFLSFFFLLAILLAVVFDLRPLLTLLISSNFFLSPWYDSLQIQLYDLPTMLKHVARSWRSWSMVRKIGNGKRICILINVMSCLSLEIKSLSNIITLYLGITSKC